MVIRATAPQPFAGLFRLERNRLLEVLRPLTAADWAQSTPCPGWNVLGLAAHLVGGDFGLLAGQRDDHLGTPAPPGVSEAEFIAWLDDVQVEWVHAARRLSPRLVVDLLDWTGEQVVELVGSQDPDAVTANVSWASNDAVPRWLDQARELSERWIHRQQILQALGRGPDLRADLAEPVLDGLRWAYPFRLGAHRRPPGDTVVVDVTGPGVTLRWNLVSDGAMWQFQPPGTGRIVAQLQMTTDQAWRLLTNNLARTRDGAIQTSGDPDVVATLLHTRAIIGAPQ